VKVRGPWNNAQDQLDQVMYEINHLKSMTDDANDMSSTPRSEDY